MEFFVEVLTIFEPVFVERISGNEIIVKTNKSLCGRRFDPTQQNILLSYSFLSVIMIFEELFGFRVINGSRIAHYINAREVTS